LSPASFRKPRFSFFTKITTKPQNQAKTPSQVKMKILVMIKNVEKMLLIEYFNGLMVI